jgi:hypothetical protein
MENLSESDANVLQTFGPGQGIVSGQAVRFPLLVKITFDSDLVSEAIGDEDFVAEAQAWTPVAKRSTNAAIVRRHIPATAAVTVGSGAEKKKGKPASTKRGAKTRGRRGKVQPEGF